MAWSLAPGGTGYQRTATPEVLSVQSDQTVSALSAGENDPLRSQQWEGLVEVGDASRRLGARAGFRRDGDAQARDAYMTALARARRQHSLDGVLRVAAAFGELGEREVVVHAVRIAEHQAADDPRARERVRAVADRLMTHPLEVGTPATIPGGVEP